MSATSQWITDSVPSNPVGGLTPLMDGLVSLQACMNELPALDDMQPLALYRWRPSSPDSPCLYNWLLPSTTQQKDTSRIRDTVVISTRIGQTYTDTEERMSGVEQYADAYRALVDVNFWDGQRIPPPIAGGATWAMRTSMQSFSEDFGSVTLMGIEFLQAFWLDRHNR